MAQLKSSKAQEFDSLVIGGGLSGLIIAHQLEGTGRRVAVVEALDALGGNCRPQQNIVGPIDNGLKFLPATPAAVENLQWLEGVLGESLGIEELDAPPLTYDSGKFQPFVGFGSFSPEAASELDYYTSPRRLSLALTPKDWVRRLSEGFAGDVFLQSHITRLQYDDGFIIEAWINGARKISAREYVFCAPPPNLAPLIPDAAASGRQKSRLAKGKFFTAVYLDMVHGAPITDSSRLHMLKGANEEPLAGVFHPPVRAADGRLLQYSQWVTFMRADLTEDAEETATALKMIKRQVKRAYETALDGLVSERILVTPHSHGEIEGLLGEDQRWPKIGNLWLASGFFSPQRNLIGVLHQCRRVLEAMADLRADVESEDSPTVPPTVTA